MFWWSNIIDPPRPGVADAVKKCHEGGVKVMMITSHSVTVTAVSIARMVNIIKHKNVKTFKDVKNLLSTYHENLKPIQKGRERRRLKLGWMD